MSVVGVGAAEVEDVDDGQEHDVAAGGGVGVGGGCVPPARRSGTGAAVRSAAVGSLADVLASVLALLAQNAPDAGAFLGDDLLPYLVLALGGALVFGNLAAIVRPPADRKEGDLERAPVARSAAMAGLGFVAAIWALASLLT
jgi:hypothetical protein